VFPAPCDLLLTGAGAVLTQDPGPGGLPRAAEIPKLSELPAGTAVAVAEGRIQALGPEEELARRWAPRRRLDARGGFVVPGFVDAHTHPVFCGDRSEEFEWRCQGLDYLEIARRGGGILASVERLRRASDEELHGEVRRHLLRMLRHGTTSCEAKSGYGLTVRDELRSLRILRAAAAELGMEVSPTFLGAHLVPAEHRDHPDRYLDLLCEEGLPAAAEDGLARSADVFLEEHAFDLGRGRRYLERARELGLRLRVHAEQFAPLGGARLAVELGADCADHLEALSEEDAGLLAASPTFAGLLPAVPHFLRQEADAPARLLLDAGARWFVATDFNPGSCYTPSLPEAIHFARLRLGLSVREALAGATCLAAASLGWEGRKGVLRPGADADLVVLDLPRVEGLGYAFGENPVRHVVLGGRVAVEDGCLAL